MKFRFLGAVAAALLLTGVAEAQDEDVDIDVNVPEDTVDDPSMEEPSMDVPDYDQAEPGTGGSPEVPEYAPTAEPSVTVEPSDTVVVMEDEGEDKRKPKEMANFLIGGGIEGYTEALAPDINAGPTWGVTLGTQPFTWMGAELSYSGAVNEIDGRLAPGESGLANGADFTRNGGQVAATFNIPTPFVQPYVLGGIGVDWYNFRGGAVGNALGFRDDTSGRIPLGGGVRGRFGALTADARLQYNALFSQQFARDGEDSPIGGGYTGMLQVGARF